MNSNSHHQTQVIDVVAAPETLEYTVAARSSLTLLLTGRVEDALDRHLVVRLAGTGASATVVGCVHIAGSGILKFTSQQRHEAPETTSDLLVKSVLSGSSAFWYEGIISVAPAAQKTDAYQRNENLLISPAVFCDSKPTLEILANDVRCTHGATTAPVNGDQLWYIMSRGIGSDDARTLVTRGFLASAALKVPDGEGKATFIKRVWELL